MLIVLNVRPYQYSLYFGFTRGRVLVVFDQSQIDGEVWCTSVRSSLFSLSLRSAPKKKNKIATESITYAAEQLHNYTSDKTILMNLIWKILL